jgi:hypothetical protein
MAAGGIGSNTNLHVRCDASNVKLDAIGTATPPLQTHPSNTALGPHHRSPEGANGGKYVSGAGATGSSGFIITSSALMFMSSSKVLPPVSAAPALPPTLEFKSSGAGTCSVGTCHQLCNYATMSL